MMEGLVEKIFVVIRNSAGFVVEQYCTVEHAGVGTETGSGGLIEDRKGLVGVRVQRAGEWGGIRRLRPSQNGWVWVSNTVEQGSRGVVHGMGVVKR